MTKSIFMPVLFSRKLKTLNVHINKIVRTAAAVILKFFLLPSTVLQQTIANLISGIHT